MANDVFAGLMGGIGDFATMWGQTQLQDKAAEKALLRQQALNRQEADLRQQALEAEMKLRAKWAIPEVNSVEVDGPDGRRVKRVIQTRLDPETGQPVNTTLGESAVPLEPNKSRTIRQGQTDVTQEFDPRSGQWTEVGRGPAFAPREARGPTEFQTRMELAKSLGATDEQLRALALGGAAGTPDKAPAGFRATQDGNLEPIPGGPADESRKARELSAEAKQKLGLIDNALRNAEEYKARVVSGKDFKDVGARTSNTPGLLSSAIQDMLYVKSGASAPVEEVKKWESIYGPSVFERDETSAKKVDQLITDIKSLRNEYDPKGIYGSAATKPKAAQAQGKYQVGQVIEANGKKYRVIGGDPSDPDVEEVK